MASAGVNAPNSTRDVSAYDASARQGVLYALLVMALWGVLPLLLKLGTDVVDPSTVVWVRFATAFGLQSLLLRMQGILTVQALRALPWGVLGCGLALAANYMGFMWGLAHAGPTQAQVVIQMAPVSLVAVGSWWFKESISKWQGVGLILVAAGLTAFSLFRAQEGASLALLSVGNLWLVFGAISWMIFALVQKNLVQHSDPQLLNWAIYGIATVATAPLTDFGALAEISLGGWALLFILGLNTLVAYGALAMALKLAPVAWVSTLIACNPLITFGSLHLAAEMGAPLDPNPLNAQSALGAIAVLIGAVMVVGVRKR